MSRHRPTSFAAAVVVLAGSAAAQVVPGLPAGPADPPPVIVRIVPPAGAAPPAALPPLAARASAQPLICRTSVEVGSLIARHKQCLTKAQWRYVDDAHETEARRLMLDNMNKPNCDAHC